MLRFGHAKPTILNGCNIITDVMLQNLRGRFIKPGVSPGERQNRLRQHGTVFIFFTNMLHVVQHVCEKEWNLPPCRRRIGAFIQMNI